MVNLSEGGAFLVTEAPPPVGEILHLRILLPEPFGSITAEGSVVRVNGEEGLWFSPEGLGLAFTRLEPDSRRKLKAFLSSGAPSDTPQLGPLRPNGERLFSPRTNHRIGGR
jgi:Tfp pilus assembly protein PilZ